MGESIALTSPVGNSRSPSSVLRRRGDEEASNRPSPRNLNVTIQEPPPSARPTRIRTLTVSQRISELQHQWRNIKADLPPQLSRRHIGMISIGGVIGTGLFLGSADALVYGGPVGALLGYSIMGLVVYCLCVSIAEMIAFLPNVGGVVGLADLYVDPALGFSLGWASWYNWSVTLPTEVVAAASAVGYWFPKDNYQAPTFIRNALAATLLCAATALNLLPSRYYGEVEFWLSSVKVLTIVLIIIVSIAIDIGASSEGHIGFKYWLHPGPFATSYLGYYGSKGEFLGFLAVLMQAAFSFFGSEVPGIAAGEVIDATINVPRALKRVWIRITLFYVGGIICAGLLVPSTNECLPSETDTGFSSPFVIAFHLARVRGLPHIINAAIMLSASSAAASDIYISSRFLYFLARRHHAPQLFAHLIKYPSPPEADVENADENEEIYGDQEPETTVTEVPVDTDDRSLTPSDPGQEEDRRPLRLGPQEPFYVLPLTAVLFSSLLGGLAFWSARNGMSVAFRQLSSMASVASLLSWIGMLFTYIRWYQGTAYVEKNIENQPEAEAIEQKKNLELLKKHRNPLQPYLAYFAFTVCVLVLIINGWPVFLHNQWKIADTSLVFSPTPTTTTPLTASSTAALSAINCRGTTSPSANQKVQDPAGTFLSSYAPLPVFVLLTLGYKMIYQTRAVRLDQMRFSRGDAPLNPPPEPRPRNFLERLFFMLI